LKSIRISSNLKTEVELKTNTQLIRPNDNQFIISLNQKILEQTGWKPEINIDNSINDLIKYWENNENTF
jgi:UDP-glucose 4-epimerase